MWFLMRSCDDELHLLLSTRWKWWPYPDLWDHRLYICNTNIHSYIINNRKPRELIKRAHGHHRISPLKKNGSSLAPPNGVLSVYLDRGWWVDVPNLQKAPVGKKAWSYVSTPVLLLRPLVWPSGWGPRCDRRRRRLVPTTPRGWLAVALD